MDFSSGEPGTPPRVDLYRVWTFDLHLYAPLKVKIECPHPVFSDIRKIEFGASYNKKFENTEFIVILGAGSYIIWYVMHGS